MQKMLKVASIGLYTRSESHLSLLSTVSLMTSWDRLDQESMRRWFQLTDVSNRSLVNTLPHQTSDSVVDWVQIKTVWRPQIWWDEVRCLLLQELDSLTCPVCRCTVLLEHKHVACTIGSICCFTFTPGNTKNSSNQPSFEAAIETISVLEKVGVFAWYSVGVHFERWKVDKKENLYEKLKHANSILYCVSEKTCSTITWSISVQLHQFLAYSVVRLRVIERWFHIPHQLSSAAVLPWKMSKTGNGKKTYM